MAGTGKVTGKKLAWLKPGIFLGAMVPLVVLLVRAATHTIGADPIAIALNQLGLLALILLWASLAATPLKIVFDVKWPIRVRKLLGLLAFFFATLHVLLYSVIDQGLSLDAIIADVTKRPFITLGFSAYVLLIPLAATSTSGMLKRLGKARWDRLHRLVYVSAILAALHFIWRVKRDISQPATYALVLAILFAVRLWKPARPARSQRPAPGSART
jgi:sulfoxide reductase heme-binding subunit YedZ